MTKGQKRNMQRKSYKLHMEVSKQVKQIVKAKEKMLDALLDRQLLEARLHIYEWMEDEEFFPKGSELSERQKKHLAEAAKYIADRVFNDVVFHTQRTQFKLHE